MSAGRDRTLEMGGGTQQGVECCGLIPHSLAGQANVCTVYVGYLCCAVLKILSGYPTGSH